MNHMATKQELEEYVEAKVGDTYNDLYQLLSVALTFSVTIKVEIHGGKTETVEITKSGKALKAPEEQAMPKAPPAWGPGTEKAKAEKPMVSDEGMQNQRKEEAEW